MMTLQPANLASWLPIRAQQRPHDMAIVQPCGRNKQGLVHYVHYTFQQLEEEANIIAAGLQAIGIGKGVRAGLMVKPGLDLFAIFFGMFKAGAVPVLIDPGVGLGNLKACMAEAQPKAFIAISVAHALRAILGWGRGSIDTEVTVGRRWFWGGHTLEQLKELGRQAGDFQPVTTHPDDPAAIAFTSGSTGIPKGVVISHGNFNAQVEAVRSLFGSQPGEIDLPTFPLFALYDPALDMTAVIPDMDSSRPAKVNPLRIFEAVRDFGVTSMFGSPALLNTVSRYGEAHGVRLSSLKRVISAGAPVPAVTMQRMLGMLDQDAHVITPYGATESLPVASITSRELLGETSAETDRGRGVCVGHPVAPMRVEIIRVSDDIIENWDDDLILPQGEIGEITVKGPVVTRSYFKREESTALAKILDGDGFWHRMGDLGYFDANGRLWFCGRKSHRVVLDDGNTLFSVSCETVFNTHPKVHRSALAGVTHNDHTVPVICIELEETAKDADQQALTRELLELGASQPHTRIIQHVLYHPGFPVDIRHNSKIKRAILSQWASSRI